MPKLNVWEAPSIPSKVLFLRLVLPPPGINGVSLVVVDEKGKVVNMGYLLTLQDHGRVILHRYFSKEFGFDLDPSGALQCGA